jgi:5'-nucleotidase (lipoprotein e(P4) family)
MRRLLLLAALPLSACAVAPVGRLASVAAPAVAAVPPGMQYLYGSGEASAISVQAWRGLVAYVAGQVRARPADSVVLGEGSTLASPRFVPCGNKPLAAVFDVDETVLLNLGFESNEAAHPQPYDEKRWQAWERASAGHVLPVPGAAKALGVLRALGVTVIFNTNRSVANAAYTEAALDGAGLGPAKHGETLFLSGDDPTGGHKDGRRATIAGRYCVVAMAGDQLGDFTDLFNAGLTPTARRAATTTPPISTKWGMGWFVLPNPVYGTALKGGAEEIFPADRRWTPEENR